jgi:molybdopterin synthase sulfur carrier subunit
MSAIRRDDEMVTVLIPHPLRKFTRGADEVTAQGTTVRQIIEYLEKNHPGLKGTLRTENGEIKAFVNIYLNKEDIRFLKSLDTTVGDGDELSIVPALAGGSRHTGKELTGWSDR